MNYKTMSCAVGAAASRRSAAPRLGWHARAAGLDGKGRRAQSGGAKRGRNFANPTPAVFRSTHWVIAMRNFLADSAARRCRWPLVLAAASLCLGSHAAGTVHAGVSRDQEDTRVVKVTTQARIHVENNRGKTIIVGRKDTDEVRIRVLKVVRAKDNKTADRWMDELQYSVESDEERVSVVTRHPDRAREDWSIWTFFKRIKDRAYIDYTIEIPAAFDAKVSAASGDVRITSLEGGVRIFGSSGDVFLNGIGRGVFVELSSGRVEAEGVGKDVYIRMSSGAVFVRDAGGSVSIRGTSGDVEIDGIGGDANVELSSGDLVAKGCRGKVSARSYGGDIRIDDAGGPIAARATSGDIFVTLTPVGPEEYVFETSSGDVDVGFHTPEGYGFRLEVDTGSGVIEGDLNISLDEISRKTLKGVVGNGGGLLRVETASGDIRINQRRE